MQYVPEDESHIAFRWHGGAYIEIGAADQAPGEDWRADDVINVWDYATDQPRIPHTLHAFQVRCDNWIADHRDDLA